MEIKIDTKNDTKEDIKKAIDFLRKFLDEKENIGFEGKIEEGAFNMFDDKDKRKINKKDIDEEKIIIEEY